ncbi:hypothetical protein J4446_00440 [Candidatus Woesearchaeota archaeon]|nr:hypothetical protein [Candidatus Woesearchaeota archaeon]
MKKINTLVRYAKAVARAAKKKGKPMARKVLAESIKLERFMEAEAKKVLNSRKAAKKKSKRRR